MSELTVYEQRFAAHCEVAHCIAVPDLAHAITMSLQWWANRMRWLAMEADVFATQRLTIEVPEAARWGAFESLVAGVGVATVTTPLPVRGAYQLFPSPVWVETGEPVHVDYDARNTGTRGTTDRALVCVTPAFPRIACAILTNDGAAAGWLRAQLESIK